MILTIYNDDEKNVQRLCFPVLMNTFI